MEITKKHINKKSNELYLQQIYLKTQYFLH